MTVIHTRLDLGRAFDECRQLGESEGLKTNSELPSLPSLPSLETIESIVVLSGLHDRVRITWEGV